MTSSLIHYFVCQVSNFDPQEYVHSKSSWKVGGWAEHMGNFHISNGRMPFYWPVPGLCRYKVKIRTTAHVTKSSKIPTDLIGVNNYPVIKTQIYSTRVCFCFLNRHIATHLASPSTNLFHLGVGGALPPTHLLMNKKSHNPQMDSCRRLLCLDSANIRW